ELGRDAVVRARMVEIERKRGLRIAAVIALDPRGGAAERFAPVGPHHEARPNDTAIVQPDRHAHFVRLDPGDGSGEAMKLRYFTGAAVERGNEMPVLDVVAERLEADLGSLEYHF